jgi:hypothetical protein
LTNTLAAVVGMGKIWTEYHPCDMSPHMKTTLTISDTTMRELKREAARRRKTMSELVEGALRIAMEPQKQPGRLPPLPEFSSGGLRVNIANRDALYHVMGQ